MRLTYCIIGIALAVFAFDRLCLWLERKGWLYYRLEKPQNGVCGNVLQELHALISQSARYSIEMKQNETSFRKSEADAPGEPFRH